jgi:uncharacterized protein (TIGR00303 family)
MFLGAGLGVWPATACLRVSDEPGASITTGRAVPRARELFERGVTIGGEWAAQAPYLVIGESVPAGTTTALAVLLALGYSAYGRVSGSMPGNAHALKHAVVSKAMAASGLLQGDGLHAPLAAVAALGDPMQPLVAGMAVGAASVGSDVLLAGGSQMLALVALVEALRGPSALERIAVGTTRWIVEDPAADIRGLTTEISADLPLLAANLNFSGSRHAGLRRYEEFFVKEGVGAGGACIAALLTTGAPIERLEQQIETVYDGLMGRLELNFDDPSHPCRGQSRPAPEG